MADQNFSSPAVKKDSSLRDQVALLSFIDKLIAERNDQNLKIEELPALRETLLRQINQDINLYLVNLLSKKDQLALDNLFKKKATTDELNKFFSEKIHNIDFEVAKVLLNFREVYLLPRAVKGLQFLTPAPVAEDLNVPVAPPAPASLFNKKLN